LKDLGSSWNFVSCLGQMATSQTGCRVCTLALSSAIPGLPIDTRLVTSPVIVANHLQFCHWLRNSLSWSTTLVLSSSLLSACNITPLSNAPSSLPRLHLHPLLLPGSSFDIWCSLFVLMLQLIVEWVYDNQCVVSVHCHIMEPLCPLQMQHVILPCILFLKPCHAPPQCQFITVCAWLVAGITVHRASLSHSPSCAILCTFFDLWLWWRQQRQLARMTLCVVIIMDDVHLGQCVPQTTCASDNVCLLGTSSLPPTPGVLPVLLVSMNTSIGGHP